LFFFKLKGKNAGAVIRLFNAKNAAKTQKTLKTFEILQTLRKKKLIEK
jgi:hypothetical protein